MQRTHFLDAEGRDDNYRGGSMKARRRNQSPERVKQHRAHDRTPRAADGVAGSGYGFTRVEAESVQPAPLRDRVSLDGRLSRRRARVETQNTKPRRPVWQFGTSSTVLLPLRGTVCRGRGEPISLKGRVVYNSRANTRFGTAIIWLDDETLPRLSAIGDTTKCHFFKRAQLEWKPMSPIDDRLTRPVTTPRTPEARFRPVRRTAA
jgi:hypothetical protein